MTLFTAEGLIRAAVRWESCGICHPPSVVHHAYLRWLATQGEGSRGESELDGWLVGERFLHARRAPGNSCLAALEAHAAHASDTRFGEPAVNDSKDCGGVMRAAPVWFLAGRSATEIFKLGVETAALTHGHVTGQLPAGVLATAVHAIVDEELDLTPALDQATQELRGWAGHQETLIALRASRRERRARPRCQSVRRQRFDGRDLRQPDRSPPRGVGAPGRLAPRARGALGHRTKCHLGDDFVLQIRGQALKLGEAHRPLPKRMRGSNGIRGGEDEDGRGATPVLH